MDTGRAAQTGAYPWPNFRLGRGLGTFWVVVGVPDGLRTRDLYRNVSRISWNNSLFDGLYSLQYLVDEVRTEYDACHEVRYDSKPYTNSKFTETDVC